MCTHYQLSSFLEERVCCEASLGSAMSMWYTAIPSLYCYIFGIAYCHSNATVQVTVYLLAKHFLVLKSALLPVFLNFWNTNPFISDAYNIFILKN